MKRLSQRALLRIKADAYVMRERPHHAQVMLNWGYHHLAIVDCADAAIVRTIALPDADDFAIEQWLVSPDGNRSYLFARDNLEVAIELEHEGGGRGAAGRQSRHSLAAAGDAAIATVPGPQSVLRPLGTVATGAAGRADAAAAEPARGSLRGEPADAAALAAVVARGGAAQPVLAGAVR